MRKNRAQVRFWLWFSASLKFLVPFSLLMSLGSHVQWAPAAKKIATPAVSFTMVQITQPFPDTLPLAPSPRGIRDGLPIVIFGVWMCGFGMIALIRFRGWLRNRAAARSSVPIDIPATVEVRSSPGLLEPGVVGGVVRWSRPILLLPAGITERLTPPQVLAHELCHIRRRDNLLASIHMLVEAMFWFHPLVWWIGARLVEERERACDEAVLSLGSEPRIYAEGILNVCKLYVESPLACASGATGSDIRRRIEAIMTNRVGLRLNFARNLTLAVAGMAVLSLPIVVGILAQTRADTPKFEVASIRPGCPGAEGNKGPPSNWIDHFSPGRLTYCLVLSTVIKLTYFQYANGHVNPNPITPQLSGALPWMDSDRYMLNAKAEGNPAPEIMRGPMLQALLEDRFKLKVHRETRQVPAYALTVAKGGPKLPRFREGSCSPVDLTKLLLGGGAQQGKLCRNGTGRKGPNATFEFHGSLDEFANVFIAVVGRPVIDKTGITGKFDFYLEFAPDQATPAFLPGGPMANGSVVPADDPTGGPSIFTAIQERLGLKLEPAKGPREFLVVDHVERPSEN